MKIDSNVIQQITKGDFILPVTDSTRYFGTVSYHPSISKIQKKGKQYFIDYFFDKYGILKDNVPDGKTLEQIIEILYNWNVYIREVEGTLEIKK